MFLNEIEVGRKAIVEDVMLSGVIRRRLRDMGVIEGGEIECAHKSPLGDPTAYIIKGALIAIRKEQAALIAVRG